MSPEVLVSARELALDSLHVYKEHEEILMRARVGRRIEVIERRNVRLFVEHFPGSSGGAQKVVFAGSDDIWDWLRNVTAWKVKRTGIGSIHKGIAECYACVRGALDRALDPHRPVVFAGHSLGGAMAQLAGAHASIMGMTVQGVHTFGAPLVGDREWAEFYDSRKIDTHCWVAGWDRIPLQPSFTFFNLGYRRTLQWHFIGLDGNLLDASPSLLAGKPWRTWTHRALNQSQDTYIKTLDRVKL